MTLWADATALARAGRPAEAEALIVRAADQGDPEGNLILAHWHLYGDNRPRDFDIAHRHLQRAAEKGSTEAIRIRAHLIASGTGCPADQALALKMLREIADSDSAVAAELSFLPRMMSIADAKKATRKRVSTDPSIEIVYKLLLPEECDYVMRLAEPSLKPSLVDDPITGRGKPDPIRTSFGATFAPHDEDLVIQAINRRLAMATGTDVRQGEAMHVMRYTPGQEYRPHLDALAGLKNQRICTAIAYLNEDFEGGATDFPLLSIIVRAGKGDVLIFRNTDARGQPDQRLRHAGQPVTHGAKWIATRWIRSGPHDPYDRG